MKAIRPHRAGGLCIRKSEEIEMVDPPLGKLHTQDHDGHRRPKTALPVGSGGLSFCPIPLG
jgi:hypothetical protein